MAKTNHYFGLNNGLSFFSLRLLSFGLMALILISLVACSNTNQVQRQLSQAIGDETQRAIALYDEVWQTVQLDYVDPSFNGQDWETWRHKYDNKLQTVDDGYLAVQTMLASLNDDYTRFLSPRAMAEQNLQIDARLFGVGIQIMQQDERLTVVSILEETPAEAAGLLPLDRITHIEDEPTVGMTVQDAADRIRGPEGSLVNLTIKRGEKSSKKAIRRARIKIKTVFTKPVSDKRLGYIRLNSFISETALQEMMVALKNLEDKEGLILDLRGNYGGLLNNAVDIADLFLKDEAIVAIKGRYDHQTRRFYGRVGNETNKPLVVLIDGGSASASEILSGALKDNHRAKLIGSKTFGKGLVQKITPLQNGSGINITISKYFTPNGRDIHKQGIPPDVKVALTEQPIDEAHDPQLIKAVDVLSRKLSAGKPDSQNS